MIYFVGLMLVCFILACRVDKKKPYSFDSLTKDLLEEITSKE